MLRLVERDFLALREIYRWRYCCSRHIRFLAGFSSQRTADRRLKILRDNGFLERKHIVFGLPSVHYLTYKSKVLLTLPTRKEAIKLEQIVHDMAVLDTAIYFNLKLGIPFADITTEKELHSLDGFGTRKHKPDFVFTEDKKKYCVEVEISKKSTERLVKNIKSNFMEYACQEWIVPSSKVKIIEILNSNAPKYPDIEIIDLEEVTGYVRHYN